MRPSPVKIIQEMIFNLALGNVTIARGRYSPYLFTYSGQCTEVTSSTAGPFINYTTNGKGLYLMMVYVIKLPNKYILIF